jgi:hypothetical protein
LNLLRESLREFQANVSCSVLQSSNILSSKRSAQHTVFEFILILKSLREAHIDTYLKLIHLLQKDLLRERHRLWNMPANYKVISFCTKSFDYLFQ